MKILHVFDILSPHTNGTSHLLYQLVRAQAARGHGVTIYTTDFRSEKAYLDTLSPVRVYPFHNRLILGGFYYTPGLAATAKKDISGFEVIHLHCFRSYQNTVIHRYARQYGVPYVLDTHGSLPRRVKGEKSPWWLLRWLFDAAFGYRILKDAARLVTENQFGAKEYEAFGAASNKIAIIPLSFPVEDFARLPSPGQFRKKYGIGDKRVVMFLGRLHWIKGIDFLVESFAGLAKSRSDVILAIVGPDNGYKSALVKLIAKLGLSDRVLFTGFLDGQEKLSALVDADVVVQSSRYENAAWAPVEAVLCGTPVIVTKGSGSGEDISRMGGGYLVEFGDKSQMAQTIGAILDDPSEAREKVRRAKEYINANLRFQHKVEEYEKLYQQCIEAARRRK